MKVKKMTPWGAADSERMMAEGIVKYGTPSHGGIHLSPARMAAFKKLFPSFETFAGGPWFEEDSDSSAVVIAFPAAFTPRTVAAALKSLAFDRKLAEDYSPERVDGWKEIEAYVASDKGKLVL